MQLLLIMLQPFVIAEFVITKGARTAEKRSDIRDIVNYLGWRGICEALWDVARELAGPAR